MEADFLRYYGLDLRVEESQSSIRRLGALIGGLPSESALARHYSTPEGSRDHTSTESAVITSGAAFANWMNTKAKKA